MRQWTYQFCTEFGFFIMPNYVYPINSETMNYSYWKTHCQMFFSEDILPPKTDWYNQKYGGRNITGSNILFITASADPWRFAGIQTLNENQQKGMRAIEI